MTTCVFCGREVGTFESRDGVRVCSHFAPDSESYCEGSTLLV